MDDYKDDPQALQKLIDEHTKQALYHKHRMDEYYALVDVWKNRLKGI